MPRTDARGGIERTKSMTSVVATGPAVKPHSSSLRAKALADRLEQGARMLADVATVLTDAEWQTRVPKDGRKVGVVVHHVATVYPLEIQLAQVLASGQPVKGVTMDDIHAGNAAHALEHHAGLGPDDVGFLGVGQRLDQFCLGVRSGVNELGNLLQESTLVLLLMRGARRVGI